VYGLGREVGVTSGPTKAIKAGVLKQDYEILFADTTSFNFVEDVADVFLDSVVAIGKAPGQMSLNMQGELVDVGTEFLPLLFEELPAARDFVKIADGAAQLPLEVRFRQPGLDSLLPEQRYTDLRAGVQSTISAMQMLAAGGQLHAEDLL
jgi:UDP-glucose 4-epimerase